MRMFSFGVVFRGKVTLCTIESAVKWRAHGASGGRVSGVPGLRPNVPFCTPTSWPPRGMMHQIRHDWRR